MLKGRAAGNCSSRASRAPHIDTHSTEASVIRLKERIRPTAYVIDRDCSHDKHYNKVPEQQGLKRISLASDNRNYVILGFAFLMLIKMETINPVTKNGVDGLTFEQTDKDTRDTKNPAYDHAPLR